jgi:branched-chain amino acid transport system ATP-binding protein
VVLLEVKKLMKDFGGLRAVNNLSFDVKEGDIMGLIGPNGSGKTTVFNLITGFHRPTSGKIMFQEKDVTGLYPHLLAKLGIVRTFQANTLFSEMSVIGNMTLGFHLHNKIGFFGELLSTTDNQKRKQELMVEAREILTSVGLSKFNSELASSLPQGYQRALQIGLALATKPKLLLLDEPVSGMSMEEAGTMATVIEMVRNRGITILLVEHEMRTVMALCDRIVVLSYGEKISEGTPQEISEDKKVVEAYLGKEET